MAQQTIVSLKGKVRTAFGKGPSRRTRAEGLIPGVLYGPHSKGALSFAVDPLALKAAIQTPFKFNTLLELDLEGAGKKTALLKEVQVDPVERDLLHADFVEVKLDEKVKVNITIILEGITKGAAEGGILNQVTRSIVLEVLPKDIPELIKVDVSHLDINDSIHVSELKLPAGAKAVTKGDITVAVCAPPEREEAPVAGAAAAAAPAADGKAAPAAAAPAAGAKAADGKAAPAAAAKPAAKK